MTLSTTAVTLLVLLVIGVALVAWGIFRDETNVTDENVDRINKIDEEQRRRRRAADHL